jgi:hypothetical protein
MNSGRWWLTLFLVIFFPAISFSNQLTWPPTADNDEPDIAIVGPISDIEAAAMSEQDRIFWGYLDSAINRLIKNQNRLMPDTYMENIGSLIKQPWTLTGSTEKEERTLEAWMVFQTRGTRPGQDIPDNEIIADALTTSYVNLAGDIPELEMGVRLNRNKSDYLANITLDGYRYIYLGPGDGVADWFSYRIDIRGKSSDQIEQAILKQLQLLLILPFHDGNGVTQTVPVDVARIPFWKDFQTLGILQAKADKIASQKSASDDLDTEFKAAADSQNFKVDISPITSEFYEQCQFIGLCGEGDIDDEFVRVGSKAEAEHLCRQRNKYLIESKSLPFMYLVDDQNLFDFIWLDDKEAPVTIIDPVGGIQMVDGESDDEGLVWCQQEPSTLNLTLDFITDPTLIAKTFRTVFWHEPNYHGYKEGDVLELNQNHVIVVPYDERYESIVKGQVLYTLNDRLEMSDVDLLSVKVSSNRNSYGYSAIFLSEFTTDVELISKTGEESISGVYVTNIGFSRGNRYSSWLWTIGISILGIGYQGKCETGDRTEIKIESPSFGYLGEIGLERPIYLLPQIRWGVYGGINSLKVEQNFAQPERSIDETQEITLNILNASARLHLTVYENLNLFSGITYTMETEGSFSGSDNLYFSKMVIPSGIKSNLGVSWFF